ncbi:SIR2 family protein [Rhizobium sp. PRIMUS64]|uniref:SIR2 family protein n=1 Tax=Rhizobium sp. PRIMUS64 TaxID=2908925 RepID=UPI001FF16CF8|nr:SIR2 family protein [Rhizobium sp. PRIMUS64]MCJ9693081.1 SIR2 family protein [Rhizobium sp. PRIMUS64]
MTEITDKLSALLASNAGAPFLFVGSGFSRRYIGLEQWDELLGRFCQDIKPFGFYASHTNSEYPAAAALMAEDFNPVWWADDKYADSRDKFSQSILNQSSALKHEIAAYLTAKVHETIASDGLSKELALLPSLNVDGIITTNWDLFLEELFPDYKVFIGQEELLFSNPQSVAEIYKIHGCASQPNSLVLTQEDYDNFNSKNAYLAAKLITIFIEHPVIFIGYSLADKNIQTIISSIVNCLAQEKLDQFGKNLIFLQRPKAGEGSSFLPSMMAIGETNLNITVIKTDDFSEVYSAIDATKRKIPARILRYCKEQMYDLVKSSDPSTKLAVVDIDQIDGKDDVEFVVGVGVAEVQDKLAKRGYTAVDLDDVFLDVLEDQSTLDANELLSAVYPRVFKRANKYVPAYRYLRGVGIGDLAALKGSKHNTIEQLIRKSVGGNPNGYQAQYDKLYRGKTTQEIIDAVTPEKAAILIAFQDDKDVDIAAVLTFLRAHKEKLKSSNSPYSSYFRKLTCLYDRLKDGFAL